VVFTKTRQRGFSTEARPRMETNTDITNLLSGMPELSQLLEYYITVDTISKIETFKT